MQNLFKNKFNLILLLGWILFTFVPLFTNAENLKEKPGDIRGPNILFLIADDMRPEMGAYSGDNSLPWLNPSIRTPALDRLAGQSLLFHNAYCQQSWCNPSRFSFLTSRRPDSTMVHNNSVYFRENMPYVITLPQYFKEHGYMTLGVGKVFHLIMDVPGVNDNEYSWTEPMIRCDPTEFLVEPPWNWWAVPDKDRNGLPLRDECLTNKAVQILRQVAPAAKSGEQPFFLAVGLKKPHHPFVFPEHYLHYYPSDDIELPANPYSPVNMPQLA